MNIKEKFKAFFQSKGNKRSHKARMIRWTQLVYEGKHKTWTQVAIDEELKNAETAVNIVPGYGG